MNYGYARGIDSKSVEDQVNALLNRGVEKIFIDCGRLPQKDRQGYQRLMNTVSKGDTIVITDMSRLTRDCLTFLHLEARGIMFDILAEELDFPSEESLLFAFKSFYTHLPNT